MRNVSTTFLLLALIPALWTMNSPDASAQTATSITYDEARRELLRDQTVISIYGVILEKSSDQTNTVSIMLSEIDEEGGAARRCTRRLLHLPRKKILSSEPVRDFDCHGSNVQKFVLSRDAAVVEERYSRVRIPDVAVEDPTAPAPPGVVNLTVVECLLLGGKVVLHTGCPKNVKCSTTTAEGTKHGICIDEAIDK